MANEIEIIFEKNGTSTMKVNGIKGKNCKDLTKSFEKALGITSEDKNTPEYYENDNINTYKHIIHG